MNDYPALRLRLRAGLSYFVPRGGTGAEAIPSRPANPNFLRSGHKRKRPQGFPLMALIYVGAPVSKLELSALAARSLCHQHGLEDLVGNVLDGGGRVSQKQRAGFVVFADGLERVEILRDHH